MKDRISNLYKVVDKLEQRISTLEKTTPKKEESKQLSFDFNQDQLSFDFNQDQPLLVELNK